MLRLFQPSIRFGLLIVSFATGIGALFYKGKDNSISMSDVMREQLKPCRGERERGVLLTLTSTGRRRRR